MILRYELAELAFIIGFNRNQIAVGAILESMLATHEPVHFRLIVHIVIKVRRDAAWLLGSSALRSAIPGIVAEGDEAWDPPSSWYGSDII